MEWFKKNLDLAKQVTTKKKLYLERFSKLGKKDRVL